MPLDKHIHSKNAGQNRTEQLALKSFWQPKCLLVDLHFFTSIQNYISVLRSTKQLNGLQGYKSHVFKNSNIGIPTPKNYSKGCHLQIAWTKTAPLNMPTCLEQSRLELPESGRTESRDPMLTTIPRQGGLAYPSQQGD